MSIDDIAQPQSEFMSVFKSEMERRESKGRHDGKTEKAYIVWCYGIPGLDRAEPHRDITSTKLSRNAHGVQEPYWCKDHKPLVTPSRTPEDYELFLKQIREGERTGL